MSWNPSDDDRDPFGDFFQEIERMVEEMDELMGPHGGINVSVHRPGSAPSRSGEIHVDFHDDGEEFRVVADLPGVAKEAIDLRSDGESLSIHAATDGRSYDERIELPVAVKPDSASATYKNGVLEVTFEKLEDDDGATDIRID